MIHDWKLQPVVKPDLDNIVKVVMDALTDFAWNDDNQVVTIEASKSYALDDEEPRLIIEIEQS